MEEQMKVEHMAKTNLAAPRRAPRDTRSGAAWAPRPAARSGATALALVLRTALWSGGAIALAAPAAANPTGGTVTAGAATISQPNATTTRIDQTTNSAVINWQSFSIAPNETTVFQQPSAAAITLNRVVGPDPSVIAGHLQANGRLVLVNQNGIAFSNGAQVNVNALVATPADIRDEDFMAGRLIFSKPSPKPGASVTNAGTITVADHGLAALVAPDVANSGVINAKLGRVVLGGKTSFAVDLYGDGLLSFDVGSKLGAAAGAPGQVTNTGQINANGGHVLLTADAADAIVTGVVNLGGAVSARSAEGKSGTVTADAGAGGSLTVTAAIDASGKGAGETGGTVKLLGDTVSLQPGARVDASGNAGGGTILVGGNLHGAGPERNARTSLVAGGVLLDADALAAGKGGTIAVWSDHRTIIAGTLSARGGAAGGDGGFIETSGKDVLGVHGAVIDTTAPLGRTGEWLLDPTNLEIASGAATGGASSVAFGDATTVINDGDINAAASDVTLEANNDITVDTGVAVNIAHGLSLRAGESILLNGTASLATTGAGHVLSLSANDPGGTGGGGTARIAMQANTSLAAGAGGVQLTLAANGHSASAGDIQLASVTTTNGGGLSVASGGTIGITQTVGSVLSIDGASSLTTTGAGAVLTLQQANRFNGPIGIAASGNASLSNDAANAASGVTTLAAGTVGGNLAVISTTGIAQSGALTVAGTSAFTAQQGGIALTQGGNKLNKDVSLATTGGDAALVNDSAHTASGVTTLAASSVGGNLAVTSTTGIAQSGALTVTGTSAFTAQKGGVALAQSGNQLNGDIALATTGGDASLANDAAHTASAVTTLAASSIGGNLAVTSTTGIAQSGALTVAGTSGFTAENGGVSLGQGGNQLNKDITLNATGGDATLVNDAAHTASGVTTLAAGSLGGNLAVTSTTGLAQSGVLSVAGTSSFTAQNGGIALAQSNKLNRDISLNTTGGNATLVNDAAHTASGVTTLAAGSVGGNLAVTSTTGIAESGVLTVAGTTSVTAQNGGIALTQSNRLDQDIALNSTGGDATLVNDAAHTASGVTTLAAGSVGGNLAVTSTTGLAQSGVLTVAGTSSFTAQNGAIALSQSNLLGKAISLNTTSGDATLVNDAAHTGSGVTTLATGSVDGNLSMTSTTGITQSGALTVAGTSSFTAQNGGITLTQSNRLDKDVSLNTTGGGATLVNDAAHTASGVTTLAAGSVGGNLAVTSTTGIAQSGALTVAGTSSFTAENGAIALGQANHLTGAVALAATGGNAVLANAQATALATVAVDGTLSVSAAGALTQAGGTAITAAGTTLAAGSGNDIALTNAGNDLTHGGGAASLLVTSGDNVTVVNGAALQLGGVTANGNVSVRTSAGTLSLAGTIDAGAGSTITATGGGGIALRGAVTTNAATTLDAGGGLYNGGGFALATGDNALNLSAGTIVFGGASPALDAGSATLTITAPAGTGIALGSATGAGAPLVLSDATLGQLAAANLVIKTTGAADISAANVTHGAPTMSLAAGRNIAFSGDFAPGAGTLTLTAAGTVGQSAGVISATNLAVTAGGTVALGDANAVSNLAISGPGQSVTFGSAGNLQLSSVSGIAGVTAATALLASGGAITQAAGAGLDVTSVALTAGGPVTLGNANHVTQLAASAAGQSVAFTGAGPLQIASLDGVNGASAGSLALTTGGGLSQAAGATISVGSLSGTIGGAVTLSEANAIGTLTQFSNTSGAIAIANQGTLQVAGPVAAAAGNLSLTTMAGELRLAGTLAAGAGDTITLTGGGGIRLTGAVSVNAPTILTAAAPGYSDGGFTFATNGSTLGLTTPALALSAGLNGLPSFDLGGAAMTIAAPAGQPLDLGAAGGGLNVSDGDLGQILHAGGLTLATSGADLVASGVTPHAGFTALTLSSGANLTFSGDVDLGAVPLTLEASQAITQTAGTIATTQLSGVGATGITLGDSNLVGTLGALQNTGSGALLFTNGQSLAVTGPITSAGDLTVATNAGTLFLSDTLSAGANNAISLSGAGGVSLTGATTTNAATTIIAKGSGYADQGNSFATNDKALTLIADKAAITGSLSSGAAAMTIQSVAGLGLSAGSAPAAPATLNLADAALGHITAGGLTLATTGAGDGIFISGTAAHPGLGDVTISAVGTLSFGPGDAAFAGNLTASAAAIALDGNVSAPNHTVRLASGSTIEQTHGGIAAATLTGSSVGEANFAGSNAVALGAFTVTGPGNFTFNEAGALTVTAPITLASGNITLSTTAGDLTIATDLAATGSVSLNSGGALAQTAGVIRAAALSGSSVGGASLGGANEVATLTGFTNAGSGDVTIATAAPLSVTGVYSVAAGSFSATSGGPLTIDGATASAGQQIVFRSTGGISLAGGAFGAPSVILSTDGRFTQTGTSSFAAGYVAFDATGAQLSALQAFDPADPTAALAALQTGPANNPIAIDTVSAPQATLLLAANAGAISAGNVTVNALAIAGIGGSATIGGTIGGVPGQGAAAIAFKSGAKDNLYKVNNCAIGTTNCIVVPRFVMISPPSYTNFALIAPARQPDDLILQAFSVGDEDLVQ